MSENCQIYEQRIQFAHAEPNSKTEALAKECLLLEKPIFPINNMVKKNLLDLGL